MRLVLEVKDLSMIQEIWDLWLSWNGQHQEAKEIPKTRFPRLCELSETIIRQWTLEDELKVSESRSKQEP